MGKIFSRVKNAQAKATAALMVAGMTAVSTMPLAFAGDTKYFGNFFSSIGGAFNEVYAGFKGIALPVALCAGGFCLIMMLMSKDQKKMEAYKAWLIAIVVCVVLIFMLPAILGLAKNFGENVNF
jgi:multisubunit Na+/H+ antiporter MnhB subunit